MWDVCCESRCHFATKCFLVFPDTSDFAKTIETQWFFVGFAVSAEGVLATSLLNDIKMFPNLVQQWSKHNIGKCVESALVFCMFFEPKMTPKMSPKWLPNWYQKWCAKRALKRWSQESPLQSARRVSQRLRGGIRGVNFN